MPFSCFIHVKCDTSFGSIIAVMKSPAKRFVPVQSAATQMSPMWTVDSAVLTVHTGAGPSALNDSAQTADQVEFVRVLGAPLSVYGGIRITF